MNLARVDADEPRVKAFVSMRRTDAEREAAESSARWLANDALSPIDGMTIGVKDIIETADLPTGQGSPMWDSFATHRDAASVQALREAGAIVLGKTATTEFASTEQYAATTNPHDCERTPGGSSSGSAAAVASGMVSVALGSQVVGSTLRPASYCGCIGYKPSVGALNRGGSYDYLSQSCVGILGSALEDVWAVARAIVDRVGGDPGQAALSGPPDLPAARRPRRLAVLETDGWTRATPGARAALDTELRTLREKGIEVIQRGDDPELDRAEIALAGALDLTWLIMSWEFRWPLGTYVRSSPEKVSAAMRQRLVDAETMTLDDYNQAIARRHEIREIFEAVSARYDGFVALGATGAAPRGLTYTGDPNMNVPASLLGVPALCLPVLAEDDLPIGLQLISGHGRDAELMALAAWRWTNENY